MGQWGWGAGTPGHSADCCFGAQGFQGPQGWASLCSHCHSCLNSLAPDQRTRTLCFSVNFIGLLPYFDLQVVNCYL